MVKIGITVPTIWTMNWDPGAPTPEMIFRAADMADDGGCFSIHVADGPIRISNYKLDPLVTIGALAARTKKTRLVSDGLLLAQRNPVRLANIVTTIDLLSDGRFTMGLGIGTPSPGVVKEYEAFGYDYKNRARRTEEILSLLKKLFTEQNVTFQGKYYQVRDVSIHPKPVQKPHPPICGAGITEHGMRRAAKYCNGWIDVPVRRNLEDFKKSVAMVDAFAKENGRKGSEIPKTKLFHSAIAKDRATARRIGAEWYARYYEKVYEALTPDSVDSLGVFGTAEDIKRTIEAYAQAGADEVVFDFPSPHSTDQLKLFFSEVKSSF